jgi:putative flippase GtrA
MILDSPLVEEERSKRRGIRCQLHRLTERYPSAFRAAKFATGSGVGFLDTEIILMAGTYLLYGRPSAPPGAFYSPLFLALNIVAFTLGITVAFFVSESLIVNGRVSYGLRSVFGRLGKFQLIFLTGNLAMVSVELLMLKAFAFPPVFGIVVGAMVSFPISYFFSMHFVWGLGVEVRKRSRPGENQPERDVSKTYFRNLVRSIPERILTPYGSYNLNVQEYRFDVFPPGGENEDTKIEFVAKIDVARED